MKFFKKNKMQSNKEVTDTNEPTPQDELLNSTEEQNVEEQQNTEENPADLLKEELAIANDKYIRLYSDFENYKKRMMRERIDLIKTAGADVIASLLPVLDDLERALKSMENSATDVNALKDGVILIQTKLKNQLSQHGLQPIDSLNKPFDTDLHEAITNLPVDDESKKGMVIDEIEKGYMLNDKVLRHAKVVVGG